MQPASPIFMHQPVSGGFSPLTLPNLTGWWDASDYSTITESSGLVTQWDDKSPAGNNFSLGSGGNVPTSPTYTAVDTNANNRPSIGASTNTVRTGLRLSSAVNAKVMYIVMNYQGSTPFSSFATIISGTGSLGSPRIMGTQSTSNLISSSAFAANVSKNGGAILPTILPLPHTVCRFNSADTAVKSFPWRIGYNEDAVDRTWIGSYSEVIMLSDYLSSTDETNLLNYLYDKWGIVP